MSRLRSALAGAAAATVWGLQEPIDQRLLRCDYSDVALLGKAVTQGPHWRAAGFAVHAANGALFGLAFEEGGRVFGVDARRLAFGMAMAEHVALYPVGYISDRYHPRGGEAGVPKLLTNPRAFAQATWRHALFGVLLGALATTEDPSRASGLSTVGKLQVPSSTSGRGRSDQRAARRRPCRET